MKPKILIIGEDSVGFDGTPNFVISLAYSDMVARAGGLPLLAFDIRAAKEYVEFADGLLLTGGQDMHVFRFGEMYRDRTEMQPTSRTRDDLDFTLCNLFIEAGKPVFGIGRGLQVLNVALGGTLYKDIAKDTGKPHPADAPAPEEPAGFGRMAPAKPAAFFFHKVKTAPGTRLAGILQPEETVNSCHHTAIKELAAPLVAAAVAEDGIIEAVEHPTQPFFAVQWHPERAAGEIAADGRVFELFVQMCKEGK